MEGRYRGKKKVIMKMVKVQKKKPLLVELPSPGIEPETSSCHSEIYE